jgi:hypothetical protein
LCLVLAAPIVGAVGNPAPQSVAGAQKPDLLALAREALGARSATVAKLVFDAEGQELAGDRVLSTDQISIEIASPNRYILRSERQSPPSSERQGFDGETYINEVKSRDPNMTAGVRPLAESERKAWLRILRERATAYIVASMLSTRAPLPMEYQPRGRATSPDGEADVVEARSPDGFVITVFLDVKTHRPLMAEYSDRYGNRASTVTLYLDDYRKMQGVWFPHQWRISRDGTPRQTLRVKRVQLSWD